MEFILLRYGHSATTINMKDVDRIVARDGLLEVNYHSGQAVSGHMIRVEKE